MVSDPVTCYPGCTPHDLEIVMQRSQIRRVPVVDTTGILVGIVTLADLAHAAQLSRVPLNELPDVALTLANITRRRRTNAPEGIFQDSPSHA
jgi:CBS domain-containing protein